MDSTIMALTATPTDLREWLARHGLDTYTGGPALGIKRRHLCRLLAGAPITPTIALLCAALDRETGHPGD